MGIRGPWQATHTGHSEKTQHSNTKIHKYKHKHSLANKLFTPTKSPWQAIHTGHSEKKHNTQIQKYTNTNTNTVLPTSSLHPPRALGRPHSWKKAGSRDPGSHDFCRA